MEAKDVIEAKYMLFTTKNAHTLIKDVGVENDKVEAREVICHRRLIYWRGLYRED